MNRVRLQRATGKSFLTREDLEIKLKSNADINATAKLALENDIEEAIINWQTKIFSKVSCFLFI